MGPDGIITTVAGTGTAGYSGDGGPATAAKLYWSFGVAVGADGALFIADSYNHRIRRVGPDGIIATVAGTGTAGYSGDGGPATAAKLYYPETVAVGAGGALLIVDRYNHRIRRVGPDGIITTVVGGLNYPEGVAVGGDGALFIADSYQIRRVGPDGIITTVAGTGEFGYSGDGGPATAAVLSTWGVAVGGDGALFIADYLNNAIRRVGSEGIITTVAGTGALGYSGDGGPATAAKLFYPQGVAVGSDGALFVPERGNQRIRVVKAALPGMSLGEFSLASEDGSEIFLFNSSGRHLRTLDATTGVLRYIFSYDANGRLASVTDGDGNVTQVQRDTDGKPLSIVAPGGQVTSLSIDSDGMLGSIANSGETTGLTYYPGGLLHYLTDPRGYVHQFHYDELGRLTRDENPAGGYKSLARSQADAEFTVSVSTALGRTSRHNVQRLSTGDTRRVNTAPDGTQTMQLRWASGAVTSSLPDGTTTTTQLGPDPRFGMEAPVSSLIVQTPAGRSLSIAESRTAMLSNPADLLSATALGETIAVNGRAYSSTYDAATRTWTSNTPMGRTTTSTLNDKGKLAQLQPPGTLPVSFVYYPTGRLWTVTQGARTYTIGYNAQGYPETITDPLLHTISFTYYPTGRVKTETLPGSRTVTFGYDASGNMTSLTPPDRPEHGFGYTPIDLTASYTPPTASSTGLLSTTYGYDVDGALAQVILPDSTTIVPSYFPNVQPPLVGRSGKLESLTTWRGTTWLDYDTGGRLWTVVAPDNGTLTLGYDGSLVTNETWTGAVAGSVGHGYDNDFRIASSSVNGANEVSYGYDPDGLMTQAGALGIPREPATGRISGTTLGVITTTPTYDSFGALDTMTARSSGTTLFSYTLTKDLVGRITGKTETIGGVTTTYEYVPDDAGRLHQVKVNGSVVETYEFDANGNRLSKSSAAGFEEGVPDDQDRLRTYGGASYTYGASGDLQSRTVAGATTWYSYDPFGNLVWSQLASGTQIEYVIDGLNRRIGKKVNGTLVEGFLYEGQLRPVAWLNGGGEVYARFVYGTRVNVPEYMTTASGTFRILTDHLGSPRLVVNTSTGAVAQRIDYDAWGNVVADTAPGFQPFGFAGGLYDRDTGLVRFGTRDYDPQIGRWTNKDPVRFKGGLNLYAYVDNDPVNFVDPSGLMLFDEAGRYAAQWYADRYVATGSWYYWAGGFFASLWTPETSEQTATVLFMAKGIDSCRSLRAPEPTGPKPPEWGPDWEWRYPEGKGGPRWFDPNGGEWRWHGPDNWHPDGHWDYNPWTNWNSPWQNVPHQ